MKRLLPALITGFLAAVGLVAVAPTPASAECPYTNCVTTAVYSEAKSDIKPTMRIPLKVGVKATGNVEPTGTVQINIYKAKGGGSVFMKTQTLSNQRTTFTLPKLKPGAYKIWVKYVPTRNSTFKRADGTTRNLRVKKPKN